MNLDGLATRTSVTFDSSLLVDRVKINNGVAGDAALARVTRMLDEVRQMAGLRYFANVESTNSFPTGVGIASSASAFAALALAASTAAGLDLNSHALSRLARHGSGSACRSIPGGFVEWMAGTSDVDSYAVSIAPPEHWDLADLIAVVNTDHKQTGSTEGHALAGTSSLQPARVEDAPRRLDLCRRSILTRDFSTFSDIVEEDSNLMHAVMMTSHPPLFYWQPATLAVMRVVRSARAGGLPVCYSIDAGPNVHVVCPGHEAGETQKILENIPGVHQVFHARIGGPTRLEIIADQKHIEKLY